MNFQFSFKTISGFQKLVIPALFIAFYVAGFSEINAQTKKRSRSSIPQPVATPVASQTLIIPEIVRRADEIDLSDPNVSTDENQTVENQPDANVLQIKIDALNAKIKLLESGKKGDADAKEKKLLMSLDILSRAEQRTESLQKQLYEVIEKENAVKARIEQLTYDMRPEMIDRNVAFAGSLRPEDLRDARRKSLESEKTNLESLVAQLQSNRAKLEQSVERADFLVEKIRLKFEKEIDDALTDEEQP
ncbi:MAG: hypothetical protein ACR2F2_02490 [Pyrinomonadaceae bacterium]